jgi:hypothetical protein
MIGLRTLFYKEVLRFWKVAARATRRGPRASGIGAKASASRHRFVLEAFA